MSLRSISSPHLSRQDKKRDVFSDVPFFYILCAVRRRVRLYTLVPDVIICVSRALKRRYDRVPELGAGRALSVRGHIDCAGT